MELTTNGVLGLVVIVVSLHAVFLSQNQSVLLYNISAEAAAHTVDCAKV